MSDALEIRVFERKELVYTAEVDGPAEMGRQRDGEEGPYRHYREDDHWRVVIARRNEAGLARRSVRVESLSAGTVRLTNLSDKVKVGLTGNGELQPSAAIEAVLPLVLQFGQKAVRLQRPDQEDLPLQSLAGATAPPGAGFADSIAASLLSVGEEIKPEALAQWLQATVRVLHSAAGSLDFFARAAQALVDLVRLDSGRVLLLDRQEWKAQAERFAVPGATDPNWQPSGQVLKGVLREKRTLWQAPTSEASLRGVGAVVAAPILGPRGEVLGALYGDRRQYGGAARPIRRLEAMLVELLAGCVAAGLARLEQEKEAARRRVQFEQFFTAELCRRLDEQPDLLQWHDAEVTILFCDIRGFSRASERLTPEQTVNWTADVLDAVSECVLDNGGVVIDYVGDEVMAMWGAPAQQPDHAALACSAALAIVGRLEGLSERWLEVLGKPIEVGVGLNSGPARVGNVGTQRKFKYGARGNVVNLASRTQGATKYFKTPILLTKATRERLGAGFSVRRLCSVRVVNIVEPVELYELAASGGSDWTELQQEYEAALEQFEQKHFHTVLRVLGNILNLHPTDGPALLLLSRSVRELTGGGAAFDPVWELPGK